MLSKLEDPSIERRFHLGVALFSLALVPPSALWLSDSVPYIVALSVFAILYSAIASYQAAKAEEELMKKLDKILAKL